MKKMLTFLAGYLLWMHAFAQTSSLRPAILPEPVKIVQNQGSFSLPETIVIEAPDLPTMATTTSFLKERLTTPTGYKVTVTNNAPSAAIRLVLNKTPNTEIGKEGYQLKVAPSAAVIA